MDRVELKVYGITYNQVKEGAYVLLLTDETELFRIPIVIGVAEAQSIAVHMKKVEPQRPLTHDIYCSTLTAFGITLDEVFIYKFADGIFYSELHITQDDRHIAIDSRTSDAVAFALRAGCPIYTTTEVLEATGFEVDGDSMRPHRSRVVSEELREENDSQKLDYSTMTTSELEKIMLKFSDAEQYEMAAQIKSIIESRKSEKHDC